jgi:hypothetical protein
MTKQAYGAVIAKVRSLCARPDGASQPEIKEAFNRPVFAPFVWLKILMDNKEVVQSGVYGEYRYFTDQEAAKAHDTQAKAERLERLEAQRLKWNEVKAQKDREKRAKARLERGDVKKPAGIKNPLKRKKPQNIVIQSTQQAKDQIRQHKAATIIWPEHVKVQHIPVPEDMRFKPAPGYKGSFLQEWQQRRAA